MYLSLSEFVLASLRLGDVRESNIHIYNFWSIGNYNNVASSNWMWPTIAMGTLIPNLIWSILSQHYIIIFRAKKSGRYTHTLLARNHLDKHVNLAIRESFFFGNIICPGSVISLYLAGYVDHVCLLGQFYELCLKGTQFWYWENKYNKQFLETMNRHVEAFSIVCANWIMKNSFFQFIQSFLFYLFQKRPSRERELKLSSTF